MKRQGSILIFVMFTFVFIISIGLYGLYMANEQLQIANNSMAKIQSQYLAESKINRIFYDDYYYENQILPSIMENTVKDDLIFKLDKSDMLIDDNTNINGKFYNHEGRRYIELSTTSDYRGVKSNVKAYGTIFNEIFYDTDNNGVLAYNTVKDKHLDKFDIFINDLDSIITDYKDKEDIRYIEINNYESVKIKRFSRKYELLGKEESGQYVVIDEIKYDGFRSENVFLIVKNDRTDSVRLETEGDINLRGIIYLEGDLVLADAFNLNGIFILRGGDSKNLIVEEINIKSSIYGALIFDGNFTNESLEINHNIGTINRFGVYLPNFIEPSLSVFKVD